MPRPRNALKGPTTPSRSPVRIPLNDDRKEKANRLQSRQALHERQINHLKSSVTPQRKQRSRISGSPQAGKSPNEGDILLGSSLGTPGKRVPILANFEEWMKMATDNKINANNSWNFALIDYFHDMSLLKEGDGVNFQKASCTLDGCVKIYTSRVDSVANETGKLLSGLAESRSDKRQGDVNKDVDDDEASPGDDEEGAAPKKARKRTQRSSEATLVPSFAQIQIKKMELEFAVDPLFKKASADFDEGGAKGLLLNHLSIDHNGRIVFDSSDDADEASQEMLPDDSNGHGTEIELPADDGAVQIDLEHLRKTFFPDLSNLEELNICPSLMNYDINNPSGAQELPFLKAAEDWRQQHSAEEGEDNVGALDAHDGLGFDDQNDQVMNDFDMARDVEFGEGGEAWAKEAAIDTQLRGHGLQMSDGNDEEAELGQGPADFNVSVNYSAPAISHGPVPDQESILRFFDQSLQKSWAGPEHWRVRRVKENRQPIQPVAKRKERQPLEIDFMAPLSQLEANVLYTKASSNTILSLPRTQWISKSRNLLPDDKHFSSKQILQLFLKPKARVGILRGTSSAKAGGQNEGQIDEFFWAQRQRAENPINADDDTMRPAYGADFFQDDALPFPGLMDDEDDDFADARERLSPLLDDQQTGTLSLGGAFAEGTVNAFGAQLVTQSRRAKPEYIQYARVAKKVDVRRLKEEIWKGLNFEVEEKTRLPTPPEQNDTEPSKFTGLVNSLQKVYPQQVMADISTSYCFICLLHLANEKGLQINHSDDFQELLIRKDNTANSIEGQA